MNAKVTKLPVRAPAPRRLPPRRVPGALLASAGSFGTLAAARSLGRSGIPVVIADPNLLTAARWSRRVAHAISCPEVESSPEEFLSWLVDLGVDHPGRVLYPTSDETAWLYALYRDVLARHFRVYVPDFDSMYTLLNKWHLYRTCRALHITVPQTCLVDQEGLARPPVAAQYPLVIKPQTQAFLSPHQKGRIVRDADSFGRLCQEFRRATTYSPLALELDPDLVAPLAQTFAESAAGGIYGLSGFVDSTGELFVAAASRKVLQWPRRLGVGLCFEEAEVHPGLASDIALLCREVGYFGAFEVEFLESSGRYELIDFNPRFYGQMGFDVARGLDLPRLVYLAALGDRDRLCSAVEEARRNTSRPRRRIYCNRIELEASLFARRLAGALSRKEDVRWRRWLRGHRVRMTDAVLDRDDWLPAAVQTVATVLHRAAHPRSTWRQARHE